MLARLGGNPTDAIRAALKMAERCLSDEALRREAVALAANPGELRAATQVAELLGDVFEDLPE